MKKMKKRMALTKCNKKRKIKMIKNLRKKFIKNVKVGSGLTVNLRNMMNESMSKGNEFVMIDGMGELIIDIASLKESKSIKTELKNIQ